MSDPKNKDWIVSLGGKQYATWPWVLDEAHKRGLFGTKTELVQIPSEENGHCAIIKATAFFGPATVGEDGAATAAAFEAYGDASPKNVNSKVATALIRMAETRAKGRALRDACNIGMTLKEELGPDTDEQRPGFREAPPVPPAGDGPVMELACQWDGCGQIVSAPQAKATKQQYGKTICREHIKDAASAKVAGRPLN